MLVIILIGLVMDFLKLVNPLQNVLVSASETSIRQSS